MKAPLHICPECHANELPKPLGPFPAVRCGKCAVKWLMERAGVAVEEPTR